MVVGSNPVAVTLLSDIRPVSSKEFFHIQASTECRFTLKRSVRNNYDLDVGKQFGKTSVY